MVVNVISDGIRASLRDYGYETFIAGQPILITGAVSAYDLATPEVWTFDAVSTAADDGTTVLRPFDRTTLEAGRYVLKFKVTTSAAGKRIETFSGTTNASGEVTFTFTSAFPTTPNLQFNILGGDVRDTIRVTAQSASSVTVKVQRRVDVIGLLPTYSNVTGANVDLLAVQK
jgi:hypothetical protein